MIKTLAKRYSFFIVALLITIVITIINKDLGLKSFGIAFSSFEQMILVVPPIMLLLGLMDVWIPRETMMKYMGDNSGITGIFLAILIGSLAAGPMYAAFPFTIVLLKKGVKFSNIIIFMNAWCVTKVSTLMFEFAALGYKFTIARLLIDLPGVILMGYLVQALMPKDELKRLYKGSS
ncbi:permease [Clostridium sp. 'White wine YQ']|uniref:permease n=1 Tax=Clostridium sp. 'White wine YQ' TaxID=3027474 RepID=UPI0023668EA2|nr:permease [Clostridium sp. 'White wine YQ']MDD7794292.1 permease [Clostridium sp. 'White wine YQ']